MVPEYNCLDDYKSTDYKSHIAFRTPPTMEAEVKKFIGHANFSLAGFENAWKNANDSSRRFESDILIIFSVNRGKVD